MRFYATILTMTALLAVGCDERKQKPVADEQQSTAASDQNAQTGSEQAGEPRTADASRNTDARKHARPTKPPKRLVERTTKKNAAQRKTDATPANVDASDAKPPTKRSALPESPRAKEFLEIHASHEGSFAVGRPWTLTIHADGRTDWQVVGGPVRHGQLNERQLGDLDTIIDAREFFQLGDDYGLQPECNETRELRIVTKDGEKTTRVHHLEREGYPTVESRRETRRFLDVWIIVRYMFEDPMAHNDIKQARQFAGY